jgi:hypothetical protein
MVAPVPASAAPGSALRRLLATTRAAELPRDLPFEPPDRRDAVAVSPDGKSSTPSRPPATRSRTWTRARPDGQNLYDGCLNDNGHERRCVDLRARRSTPPSRAGRGASLAWRAGSRRARLEAVIDDGFALPDGMHGSDTSCRTSTRSRSAANIASYRPPTSFELARSPCGEHIATQPVCVGLDDAEQPARLLSGELATAASAAG